MKIDIIIVFSFHDGHNWNFDVNQYYHHTCIGNTPNYIANIGITGILPIWI